MSLKAIKTKKQCIWYDEDLLSEPVERCFNPGFWQDRGKVIGSAQGRGTTWFIQTELLQAALRHYRRGGLFGKIVKDHYLFSGWEKTRSYQEFQLLKKLNEAGVNVPRPIAAKASKVNFCYQADLLSEKIPNARDLVSILRESSLPEHIYEKIGQEIRKMHDVQVNHTDLNIHNILVDSDDKVWIIDFDKCFQQEGQDWKSNNLDRLLRSFNKETIKVNIHFEQLNWKMLLEGYN